MYPQEEMTFEDQLEFALGELHQAKQGYDAAKAGKLDPSSAKREIARYFGKRDSLVRALLTDYELRMYRSAPRFDQKKGKK